MSPRPILTVAEMAQADRDAVARGATVSQLMQKAGRAVARAVEARFAKQPVRVICGPGDNGGDGYVAACDLAARGWPVTVEALASPETDASREARARWTGPIDPWGRGGDETLVIDALFGAGLNRPLDAAVIRRLEPLVAGAHQVVAVDVPSGLSGDTGRPVGAWALSAVLTVTFQARKPAHVLLPGRERCGEIVVADIGLGEVSSRLFENDPGLWLGRFPWPSTEGHKHSRGRLGVVSGGPWRTGAARLAARAGLRAGAGLVTVVSPRDALAVNAAHLEAVMLVAADTDDEIEDVCAEMDAVVVGPAAGVDDATRDKVLALGRTGAALVVDADAITVFRTSPADLFSLLDVDDVLTPHAGEFERLFPGLLAASDTRIAAAREGARRAGAVVLLKGGDTVIAHPDGRAAVTLNAPPWLATAGSGDVLAGFISGLLAQGVSGFDAACAGAWIHAEAAERFGPGLISEDLPDLAPQVLSDLYARQ
ncbi:MAG: NAD(P)H-hydrate dehydratase [Phenylobacterium sp.]|nr:NAD(P)H-hydrate dehydratase [Phenylobacterium sp.]